MGSLGNTFGQSAPKNEYQPDWTFYFSNVNDKLSSIATDLNLKSVAPIKGQENVVYVSIEMPNPRDNGLSSNEDADELWKIEDEIIDRFDKNNLNYTFVGRLTSDGYRDLYFFGENTILMEKEVSAAMIAFPNHKFDYGHKLDKEWSGYFDFLYPLPQQMQSIQNRKVLAQLEKAGDQLTKEREVFHWIYFKTQNELDQFEDYTNSLGFKTLTKENTEQPSEYKFVISIARIDKVGYNDIDDYTLKLSQKAAELNGDYDGWETSVEL
ncbi:DUF695 domain-containing protein [Zobellia galactanivorans]|uniref:TIGR01619 family protein n=1 Tax=Zobellia galactanivorans (strain DSM 12802 / CCUG 47099 / CIP 106680 / NCIMB 13871 / Dsij) TaxID=63186 RepID=G0L413_ZOBGA|nr:MULTISPECIES: DUF695 domain-containing protein [Zobellia]MBU3025841.1 DUF695 domain-containing protein [Zobellia galactanivorans]MDO6808930.1 DUF695 domain-containing protein [Zobellia galactanivorans]OWW25904.1 hypothetical protein B4Q04_09960 [Zobellia sp. OII3]CAZ98572.1 Conserved hypothetical protein [Zobellia galactanivorans]